MKVFEGLWMWMSMSQSFVLSVPTGSCIPTGGSCSEIISHVMGWSCRRHHQEKKILMVKARCCGGRHFFVELKKNWGTYTWSFRWKVANKYPFPPQKKEREKKKDSYTSVAVRFYIKITWLYYDMKCEKRWTLLEVVDMRAFTRSRS